MTREKSLSRLRHAALFAMYGALMFCARIALEALPNIHLTAMFIVTFTTVYRARALIPIYIFVLLSGLTSGFAVWWVPYLYIWTVLWALTMCIPKRLPKKAAPFVYCALCGLFGLLYGALWAPYQALVFHMSFSSALAWIAAGLPFDVIHAAGNLVFGLLVCPLSEFIKKAEKRFG